MRTPRYKLMVTSTYGGYLTTEYQHPAFTLKAVDILARELLNTHHTSGIRGIRVECYPYNENVKRPKEDYRFYQTDLYGRTYWKFMHVDGEGNRVYGYTK